MLAAITLFVVSSVLAPAALSVHPPDDGHHHPHNPPHRHSDDRSRFTTNRASDVVLPLPSEEDAFFFVVFGDRTGGPAAGVKVLAQAVEDTNLLEPDLVMTVGDLVEGYNERAEWMAQMREYKGIMDRLLCPWFPVSGNHDIYWRPNETAPAGGGQHEADYEMHFGPLWYAFEHKNAWFIALYSDEGNPETGEKDFNKPEAQRMSDAQLTWLQETLAKAKDAEHVFLFLHHPRWLGGNYGDDWQKVHRALVEAGNVTAVFAGHIHHMRSDPKDGIEYVTLATVGGAQESLAPEAGYLHQFHVVTVRKEQVAMACLPVGGVMDVRAITGQVSEECARLAQTWPSFDGPIEVKRSGEAECVMRVTVSNPTSRPIEVTVAPESGDSRWMFGPDHDHQVVEPAGTAAFEFHVSRVGHAVDHTWRSPELVVDADYLTEGARFAIPTKRVPLPLAVDLPAPSVPGDENALATDGRGACLRVAAESLRVPDGPMTLEAWCRTDSIDGRIGLVTKTENSDYGIFVNEGVPSFSIFLGDRYAEVKAPRTMLPLGGWTHIAGVYDGKEVRLYVNGALVSKVERSGRRKTNGLPLYVGADVDGNGNPMSFFHGQIDEVRVSSVARYAGERVNVPRRHASDDSTLLLLHMDALQGPWAHDASPSAAHATVRGAAAIGKALPDE
jgi:hypothetical protein